MVTVPEEGLVHSIVVGWPAVTSRVLWPSGMLMAFCCAKAREVKRATAAYKKRMLTVDGCVFDKKRLGRKMVTCGVNRGRETWFCICAQGREA